MPILPESYLVFRFDQKKVKDEQQEMLEIAKRFGLPHREQRAFLKAYRGGDSRGLCDGFSFAWIAAKLYDSTSGNSGPQPSRQAEIEGKEAYLRAATQAQTYWQGNDKLGARAIKGGHPLKGKQSDKLPPGATQLQYEVIVTSVEGAVGLLENSFVARICSVPSSATQLTFPVGQGRHSIAFYRSHGKKVYIFDPNHGEYQIRRNLLAPWLIAFLNQHYSKYDDRLAAGADGQAQSTRGWILRRWYYSATVTRGPFGRAYGSPRDLVSQTV